MMNLIAATDMVNVPDHGLKGVSEGWEKYYWAAVAGVFATQAVSGRGHTEQNSRAAVCLPPNDVSPQVVLKRHYRKRRL